MYLPFQVSGQIYSQIVNFKVEKSKFSKTLSKKFAKDLREDCVYDGQFCARGI